MFVYGFLCNSNLADSNMKWISQLRRRWARFLHNDELKKKIYSIVFESDTPQGKMFDIILIGSIILSVLLVILESMHIFPRSAYLALRIMEYVLTLFFTIEYLARVYCLKQPLKYVFSFFGIVDLLATLPVYLSFFLHGSHYLLVIRAFRLIRIFRVFKLFLFIKEGNLLLRSLWMSAPKILIFFFFVLILVTSMGTVMYMIEGVQPGSAFNNIPNSIYWAIVTMTTVGYGDITPVTPGGALPVGGDYAYRLHDYRGAYWYRFGHDGTAIQAAGKTALSRLP